MLTGLAGSAALGLAPPKLFGQAPAASQVNSRITVISGLGGNVVLGTLPAALVVVDSGNGARTAELLAAVDAAARASDGTTLFNTHWHLDQVGGNSALRARGARIIAHRKTYAHLSTPYYLPDEDRYQPALPADAHPTESFYDAGALDAGGETVHYGYLLEAHTDGDIYVQFDVDNVIAAGDAISPVRDPEIDWYGGGWLGGRADALKLLLDISDTGTRFVPSYGPIVDRAYVQSEHQLMVDLFDLFFERVRAGESAEDMLASGALDSLDRRFDNPMKFLYAAHKSMWAHYNTLSHDIV